MNRRRFILQSECHYRAVCLSQAEHVSPLSQEEELSQDSFILPAAVHCRVLVEFIKPLTSRSCINPPHWGVIFLRKTIFSLWDYKNVIILRQISQTIAWTNSYLTVSMCHLIFAWCNILRELCCIFYPPETVLKLSTLKCDI